MTLKSFFFLLMAQCLMLPLSAQIRFVDAESHLPIPALSIYHANGTLIGLTDKNGSLEFLEGTDPKKLLPAEITTQHISYTAKTLLVKSADEAQEYSLTPRATMIQEVVVKAQPREVLVLKGYFRSLEIFNRKHKYFIDGIVEYYIPLKKGKPRYRLTDYRVFQDKAVTADYDEKMGPFFQIARVPNIHEQPLVERLKEDVQKKDTGNHRTLLLKKGKEIGHLTPSSNGKNLQVYIDAVLPDTVKKEKIFRLEAYTLQSVQIENYTDTTVSGINVSKLASVYENEVAFIKRKAEFGKIPFEGLRDFYVTEKRYISNEDYKKLRSQLTRNVYKTPEASHYDEKFWEDLDQYNIPPLQPGLEKALEAKMELIK